MALIEKEPLLQAWCSDCPQVGHCQKTCEDYELITTAPEVEAEPVNRAAILRLCNEIEDLAADIGNRTMMDVVYAEARMIFDKAKEIGKELTGDADM